ncbi:MAG: hypothetical protein RL701_1098 [Pseudomonadota bacterium]
MCWAIDDHTRPTGTRFVAEAPNQCIVDSTLLSLGTMLFLGDHRCTDSGPPRRYGTPRSARCTKQAVDPSWERNRHPLHPKQLSQCKYMTYLRSAER